MTAPVVRNLQYEVGVDIWGTFRQLTWEYDYRHEESVSWSLAGKEEPATDDEETDDVGASTKDEGPQAFEIEGFDLIQSFKSRQENWYGIFRNDQMLVYVSNFGATLGMNVCGADPTALNTVIEQLRTMFPPAETKVTADERVITFWSKTERGPTHMKRNIGIVHWGENDLQMNYTPKVGMHLDDLMSPGFSPDAGGQLILMTGPPGTGKTFALRALADAWREWCDVHYIIDPEVFLNDPIYMMSALVGEEDNTRRRWIPNLGKYAVSKTKWRLIILEDTGELLSHDAKDRTGQGLARLLNVTDGFLGQGLKNLVLITTNEEVGKLHPAIIRPGRCLAHVKFEKFDETQANEWLLKHAHEQKVDHGATLAELYAKVSGTNVAPYRELAQQVGFRP